MVKIILSLIFIILTGSVAANSQGLKAESALHIATVIDAKVIKTRFPVYPISEERNGNEAWVEVSYVIDVDGSVAHALIVGSSGGRHFEDEVLKTLKKWKYQPAMSNSKAIVQCNNDIRFTFGISTNDVAHKSGARKGFIRKYKKVIKQISANNLKKADILLTELRKTRKWNLYEDAWYRLAKSEYYAAIGDQQQELDYLIQAVYFGMDDYLPKESRLDAQSRIFTLQLMFKQYADALITYERIKKRNSDSKLVTELQPYVEKINAINNSEQFIRVAATLNEQNFWTHKLLRSSFGFNAIKGRVNKMDIRCKNKRTIFRIKEEQVWTIPSSWGQCTLYIDGESGSQFTLIELPDSALKKST